MLNHAVFVFLVFVLPRLSFGKSPKKPIPYTGVKAKIAVHVLMMRMMKTGGPQQSSNFVAIGVRFTDRLKTQMSDDNEKHVQD